MNWCKSFFITLTLLFSSFTQANCVSFGEWQKNTNDFLTEFTKQAGFFYIPELNSFKLVNKAQHLYEKKINFSVISFKLDPKKKCIHSVTSTLKLDSKELRASLEELMQMAEDLIPINNSYVNNFSPKDLLEEQYNHVASHFYNNYKAPAEQKKNPLIFTINNKEFKFVYTQDKQSLNYVYSAKLIEKN